MLFRRRKYKAFDQQIREFRIQFSEDVFQQTQGRVRKGPLEGFTLVDEFSWGGMVDVTAKIFGTYERQNFEIFAASDKTTLVDIGAADGFWGVGLVHAGYFARSICFERVPRSQRIIRRTARCNGILDKIEIRGQFDGDSQRDFVESHRDLTDLFFLVDIEGAEFGMLSAEFLKTFRTSEFLVELHTPGVFGGQEKQLRLLRDAERYFDISLINDDIRDASPLNEIEGMPENIRRVLLSEGRAYPMQWLHLKPRTKSAVAA